MKIDPLPFVIFLALAALLFRKWRREAQNPALINPLIFLFEKSSSLKIQALRLKRPLLILALACLAISAGEPKIRWSGFSPLQTPSKPPPSREGIGIFILLDNSGSMDDLPRDSSGRSARITKMALAKQATFDFINGGVHSPHGRKNDLIGLATFARSAKMVVPLTLDHQLLLHRLNQIKAVHEDRLNGTAIGYALFKTVNIINGYRYYAEKSSLEDIPPLYTVKNYIIIVMTDGLQGPNPEDRQHPYRFLTQAKALALAKEYGIRVYYIMIDPLLDDPSYKREISEMRSAISDTGGKLYLMTRSVPLSDIYSDINKIEKSAIIEPAKPIPAAEVSIANPFLAAALILIGAVILIETLYARSIP